MSKHDAGPGHDTKGKATLVRHDAVCCITQHILSHLMTTDLHII